MDEALHRWRRTRSPADADQIDELGSKAITRLRPPGGPAFHPWWLKHAAKATAADHSVLLARADHRFSGALETPTALRTRLKKDAASNPLVSNVIDELLPWAGGKVGRVAPALGSPERIARLAALLSWEDDPRLTAVLCRWFSCLSAADEGDSVAGVQAFARIVAQRLVSLRDRRCLGWLAKTPRPTEPAMAALRDDLLEQIARAMPEPVELAAERPVSPRSAPVDLEQMLAAVARAPDDDAPRLVLADLYSERGDPRGTFIALQVANAREPQRARTREIEKLLARHRDEWLGPLARILDEKRTHFRRGLLDEAGVGVKGARADEYRCPHPLLATVRTVMPVHASPKNQLRFLSTPGLAVVSLGVDALEVLRGLPAFPLVELTVMTAEGGVDEALATLDERAPGLRRVRFAAQGDDAWPAWLGSFSKHRREGRFAALEEVSFELEQSDDDLARARRFLGAEVRLITPAGPA